MGRLGLRYAAISKKELAKEVLLKCFVFELFEWHMKRGQKRKVLETSLGNENVMRNGNIVHLLVYAQEMGSAQCGFFRHL